MKTNEEINLDKKYVAKIQHVVKIVAYGPYVVLCGVPRGSVFGPQQFIYSTLMLNGLHICLI